MVLIEFLDVTKNAKNILLLPLTYIVYIYRNNNVYVTFVPSVWCCIWPAWSTFVEFLSVYYIGRGWGKCVHGKRYVLCRVSGEGRFRDNFGKGSARECSVTKPGRLVLCSPVFRLICNIYISNFKREKSFTIGQIDVW